MSCRRVFSNEVRDERKREAKSGRCTVVEGTPLLDLNVNEAQPRPASCTLTEYGSDGRTEVTSNASPSTIDRDSTPPNRALKVVSLEETGVQP